MTAPQRRTGGVHAHGGQPENPHAGQGSVLLDIGGDIGALVLDMPAALEGVEIEVRPVDRPAQEVGGHLPHVAVVARPADGFLKPSAVFPELREGRYELYERPAGPVRLSVQIHGGEVTEARWPR